MHRMAGRRHRQGEKGEGRIKAYEGKSREVIVALAIALDSFCRSLAGHLVCQRQQALAASLPLHLVQPFRSSCTAAVKQPDQRWRWSSKAGRP